MRHALLVISRLFLGTVFVLSGLNGFLHFFELPSLPPAAERFWVALEESGYFLPFLRLMELAGGVLVLFGRFIPLGLLILAPIILNIFLFHVFLAPGWGMTVLVLVLALAELYLAFSYFRHYEGIFTEESYPDTWEVQHFTAFRFERR